MNMTFEGSSRATQVTQRARTQMRIIKLPSACFARPPATQGPRPGTHTTRAEHPTCVIQFCTTCDLPEPAAGTALISTQARSHATRGADTQSRAHNAYNAVESKSGPPKFARAGTNFHDEHDVSGQARSRATQVTQRTRAQMGLISITST